MLFVLIGYCDQRPPFAKGKDSMWNCTWEGMGSMQDRWAGKTHLQFLQALKVKIHSS